MSNAAPRRVSVFSGLFWILLGSALLLIQLYPELGGWDLLRRFWPLILILWGLAKLFDAFATRQAGHAASTGFSGGDVLLLLLILTVGCVFFFYDEFRIEFGDAGLLAPWEHEYRFAEEVKSSQPIPPNARINIANIRGDVTVTAADTPEIRVAANKILVAGDEAAARERAGKISVAIAESGGNYEIRTRRESGRRMSTAQVSLEVVVPRKASLEVKTERGSIQVNGLTGAMTLDTPRGDIEVRDAGQDVEINMRRGDARVSGVKGSVKIKGRGSEIDIADVTGQAIIEGSFYGPIRTKNVGGGTRFLSSQTDLTIGPLPGRMELGGGDLKVYDTPSPVLVTTREKDIYLENVGGRIRIENRRGQIEVRLAQPPKEEIEVNNSSGGVELVLPGNSAFELSAVSRNGEVNCEFEGPELKKGQDDERGTVEGKIGARGPRILLRTTYGSIRIRKGM